MYAYLYVSVYVSVYVYVYVYRYTYLKYCPLQVLPLYPMCTLVCLSALALVPTGIF